MGRGWSPVSPCREEVSVSPCGARKARPAGDFHFSVNIHACIIMVKRKNEGSDRRFGGIARAHTAPSGECRSGGTKPILRAGRCPRQRDSRQLPGVGPTRHAPAGTRLMQRTKAISQAPSRPDSGSAADEADTPDQSCETNPILPCAHEGRSPGGRKMRNEPNWPRSRRGPSPVLREDRRHLAGTPGGRRAAGRRQDERPDGRQPILRNEPNVLSGEGRTGGGACRRFAGRVYGRHTAFAGSGPALPVVRNHGQDEDPGPQPRNCAAGWHGQTCMGSGSV
jgi:hypothetical protein